MKRNPMLARIEAAAEARYQVRLHASMDMLLQMGQDAAMIAAHDVLQLGPGRAEDFCVAYREAINDMARRVVDDQMDDPEFVYAKAKIDEQIRAIVGPEKFAPLGGTLWREIGAPGANTIGQSTARPRKGRGCATICWTMVMGALRMETTACLMYQSEKIYLTNQCLTVMIKKGMCNLMQNEVEKMKIGVGAMSELLRMFYDSLIQQNFTPEQAIQLTSDYMKAVFGK